MPLVLLLILLALVAESIATAWNSGALHNRTKDKLPVLLPVSLAVIRSLTLAMGIFIGNWISGTVPWHYIIMAYVLMGVIGLKIAWESFKFTPEERIILVDNYKVMLLLSVAGSFNTFFVALSIGLIGIGVVGPFVFTLLATLIFSFIALQAGWKYGLRPITRYTAMFAGVLITAIALRFFILYFIKQ